jgi:nicotinamide mononucleotide transporter
VPTAVLYTFYGLFVVYGFTQWVKASRVDRKDVEPQLAGSTTA